MYNRYLFLKLKNNSLEIAKFKSNTCAVKICWVHFPSSYKDFNINNYYFRYLLSSNNVRFLFVKKIGLFFGIDIIN